MNPLSSSRQIWILFLVFFGSQFLSSAPALSRPKILASASELFRPPHSKFASISPSGRYVAIVFTTDRREALRIHDVDHGTSVELFHDRTCFMGVGCPISALNWVDADSLIVSFEELGWNSTRFRKSGHVLIELDMSAEALVPGEMKFGTHGVIVDSLPNHEDEILFWPFADQKSVYRMDPRQLRMGELNFERLVESEEQGAPESVASLDEQVYRWIVDGKGEVRAAWTVSDDGHDIRIWYRPDLQSGWRVVHSESESGEFSELVPLGFTSSGDHLLVASSMNRDRYGLYEYDPDSDSIGDLVYEHPTAQLVDLVYDYSNNDVLAAIYFEEGERKYAYLRTEDKRLEETIKEAFGDQGVSITSLSRDRRRITLRVTPPGDPGAFWILDLDSEGASEIGRIRPWLDNNLLATTRAFQVQSTDGVSIDGFLTLPPLGGPRPPLVVMPHGGPIGVADYRGFSSELQYLARSGFAVLQVNYRGSGGYGRRFQKKGHRQWGRGIEDDIEAALAFVIERGWVDAEKMCTMGGSYGGYSALMLVIRHPKRFRCAASLMSVTDIPLMFNSDALWLSEGAQKQIEEFVGNPDEDYAEQREFSPIYNAQKIHIPVYLAHGEWDRRVDIEHMTRMKVMLQLEKVPLQLYRIPRTGHGFRSREDSLRYWQSLRSFLMRSIAP